MKTAEKIISLLKKNHPNIKLVGEYIHSEKPILCRDQFGEVLLNIKYHIKKGHVPTIKVAVDKTEYWVNYVKKKHNNDYDYSKVLYVWNKSPVIIICKKHGEFKVTPNDHDGKNSNCPKCKNEKHSAMLTLDTKEFVKRANKKHSNKYDYSNTNYNGVYGAIKITCPIHGEQETTALKHLTSSGCVKCGETLNIGGYCAKTAKRKEVEYKKIKAIVYLVKFYSEDEVFLKVGITKNDIVTRMREVPYEYDVVDTIKTNLYDAINMESLILFELSDKSYNPINKFGGHTECILINSLNNLDKWRKKK